MTEKRQWMPGERYLQQGGMAASQRPCLNVCSILQEEPCRFLSPFLLSSVYLFQRLDCLRNFIRGVMYSAKVYNVESLKYFPELV